MKKKKFKLSRKTKLELNKLFASILIIFSFIFIYEGSHLYFIGFHNVDLAFNAIATGVFNLTTIDKNNDFKDRTLVEGYINGGNQQQSALVFFLLAGCYLIGGIWKFNRLTFDKY